VFGIYPFFIKVAVLAPSPSREKVGMRGLVAINKKLALFPSP